MVLAPKYTAVVSWAQTLNGRTVGLSATPGRSRSGDEENAALAAFFYGNFEGDHQEWIPYPPQPRYGVQYLGLRNCIGILSESYTHAPFRDRCARPVRVRPWPRRRGRLPFPQSRSGFRGRRPGQF